MKISCVFKDRLENFKFCLDSVLRRNSLFSALIFSQDTLYYRFSLKRAQIPLQFNLKKLLEKCYSQNYNNNK